jgi:hypothetical protein
MGTGKGRAKRHPYNIDQDDTSVLTDELYQKYFWDPEISELLDAYLDGTRGGLVAVLGDGVAVDDAFSPDFYRICKKLDTTIAERIWAEFPTRQRSNLDDRRFVKELAEKRAGELTARLFWMG